ncbi:putative membrane protein YuaF [Bacillus sp. THAF10]|nr:putative membrane protein YuaF [Bacillus sp. THAF10]
MTLFGMDMQALYFWCLLIFGGLTLIYILLSDVVDGIFDVTPIDPALIFSFFTVFGASGFLFEKFSALSGWLVLIIATILSLLLVILLHIFVFVPIRSADASLGYTDDDLKGKLAKVIISIPKDGFGEVVLSIGGSTVSRSAQSFDNEDIAYDTEVLIIDVQTGVVSVTPYEKVLESYNK